ncbi:hypothetical protein E4U21_007391 [Claviceps maximensis]|nr:hypothetical protein E4U21_007391 [Claviceps maximensis]
MTVQPALRSNLQTPREDVVCAGSVSMDTGQQSVVNFANEMAIFQDVLKLQERMAAQQLDNASTLSLAYIVLESAFYASPAVTQSKNGGSGQATHTSQRRPRDKKDDH